MAYPTAVLLALIVIAVGAVWIARRGPRAPGSGGRPGEARTSGGAQRPRPRIFGGAPAGGGSRTGAWKLRSKGPALALSGGDQLTQAIGDLPADTVLVRDVATAQGAIPAVLLGPTGLWALGATTARGTVSVIDGAVSVDGRTSDLSSELWRRGHALAEAMAPWLDGELPVLNASLVFVDPRARLIKREAMGVVLVEPGDVREAVLGGRVRLDPSTLADLREALARASGSAV